VISDKIKRVLSYDVKDYDLVVFTTVYDKDVNDICRLNNMNGVKYMFFAHEVTPKLL
jgi:hypothetical protein